MYIYKIVFEVKLTNDKLIKTIITESTPPSLIKHINISILQDHSSQPSPPTLSTATLSTATLSTATLSIATLSIATLSIATLSIATLSIATLSIATLSTATLSLLINSLKNTMAQSLCY